MQPAVNGGSASASQASAPRSIYGAARPKDTVPLPYLVRRRGDVNRERKPQGVHQKVALAAFDVLVGIVATWVGRFFCGCDTLGVHDGRCWLGILAHPLPLSCVQLFEDEVPQPVQSESPVMVVNGRPWREVMGQKPPMTTTFQDVEDGVKNIAQGVGAWSSFGFWDGCK